MSWFVGRPGIEKQQTEMSSQLQQKDAGISGLKQEKLVEQRLKNSLMNKLDDQNKEIARITQAEKSLKIDFDKQVSDLRSQVNTKDAEIGRLIHQNNDEQQLRNNIQRQLSNANSELIKKSDEVNRLKTQLAQRQQFSPTRQFNTSLNDGLVSACYRGDERKVRDLLGQGADPNLQTQMRGRTPLIIAVENNHLGVVRTLLSLGANPLIRSKDAWTAEDYAKFLDRTNPEILELLRKYK
jgi:ankyrin repeat protein